MESMGKDPNPDTVKLIEGVIFPLEVSYAKEIHTLLPDVWDGAGGNYLGKDWSALGALLKALKIAEPQYIILFLRMIDSFTTRKTNEDIEKNRKRRDLKSKAPTGNKGISVNG